MKNIIHKLCEKESSASIKRWIREADKEEIDSLILDINARYEELYPDWDISYVALPKKDVEERKRILAFAFHMSEHYGQIEEITKKNHQ